MKKLKIEDLHVDSFETGTGGPDLRGTVRGHESQQQCTDNTNCFETTCASLTGGADCTLDCSHPYGCGPTTASEDATFCGCDTVYDYTCAGQC
jgi:hypothetical protein